MLSGWVYDMRPVCLRLVCSPIKVLILFQYCYYLNSISILIYYMLNVTISIMLTFRNCEQSTFWNQVGLRCVIKPGITRRVICQSLSTWEWTTGPAHPAPPPHLSRRHTGVEPVTNSCEKSSWLPSAARFEGWSGEGTWTAIEADCGGFPDCRNTAAPPVGFPRLVQYSPVMAPIPVYRGQGQCQAEGPHILLCTAHIIQPPPTHFRIGLQGRVIAITVKAIGSGRAIWWNISLGERSFRVDNLQWDLLSGWWSSWGIIINRVLTPVSLL